MFISKSKTILKHLFIKHIDCLAKADSLKSYSNTNSSINTNGPLLLFQKRKEKRSTLLINGT